jgi:putative adhesin
MAAPGQRRKMMRTLKWKIMVTILILPLFTVFFCALPLRGEDISARSGIVKMKSGETGTYKGGSPPGPFGDHWVKLQEVSLVDSYDSRIGPYISTKGAAARVGSNCDPADEDAGVWLDNNAVVKGDISVTTPEDAGDITILNSELTGNKGYSSPAWELLPLTMPEWYTEAGGGPQGVIVGAYGSRPGEYEITNHCLQAYNGADLTFSGGVYHFDTFELAINVNFRIDSDIGEDEMVEIYVSESIVFENLSELLPPIAFTGDTTKLRFYFDGTATVDLSNNVEFYGFIYAPNALIEVRNNDSVYGNLVGKEVKIWNGGEVHYDKALMSEDFGSIFAGGIPANPHEQKDWKEIIVSD